MTAQNRREARFKIRIPALLIRGKDARELYIEDVSFRGIFLRTYDPPTMRQLVQIRVTLPPDNVEVCLHGMAVHVVRPGQSAEHEAGVGVQLLTSESKDQRLWDRFIRTVRKASVGLNGAALPVDRLVVLEGKPNPKEIKFRLRIKTLEQLRQLHFEGVARGGLFLPMLDPIPVSSPIHVVVVHPTSGASFSLHGVVQSQENINSSGISVALNPLSEQQMRAFVEFTTLSADQTTQY